MDAEDFEKLSAKEQEQVFHRISFKEKAGVILRAHQPDLLTRSLSNEELYLLTREMDIEERAEIIRYATLQQLFFVSDLDCWKQDRLDKKGFVQWLETLAEGDERKLLQWLLEADYETVVAGFYHLIQVMKPDREWTPDDVLGDTPYFTLDQMYYIFVDEDNMVSVRRAIEVLFEKHRGRYTAILEGVMGELEDELEEEAFRRREIRLAERGFPDAESARKIYRPITREELEAFPSKQKSEETRRESDAVSPLPNYAVLWAKERFFLDDVIHSFQGDDASVSEGLQEELAWLSNKVIACEGIDFSSEEKVRAGIEQARGFLNLGLETLSGGDINRARALLAEKWLELIFRYGVSQVFALKDKTREIVRQYWNSQQVDFLGFMDSPYDLLFSGLLRSVPRCYDEAAVPQGHLRPFKTASDVARLSQTVSGIETLHALIWKKFRSVLDACRKRSVAADEDVSLFRFLGTVFAGWILTGRMSCLEIKTSDVVKLIEKGFHQRSSQRVLTPDVKASFVDAFVEPSNKQSCFAVLALFFDRFEDEFSQLTDFQRIEPHFFSILFLSAPPKKATHSGSSKTRSRKK